MSAGPTDPALQRALDEECMRLSFSHLYFVTWATMLMALVLAAIMASHVPLEPLTWWVVVYFALSPFRLGVALWYRRRPRTGDELRRMLPLLALGMTVAPLSWSALVFLVPQGDISAYVILLMFAGGLAAGGAQTMIGTPRIFFVNALLSIGPVAAHLLFSGIAAQVYMGLVAIFFYLITLQIGRRNLAVIREAISLRFSNQRLVEELTRARDQAETARDTAERAIDAKNRFLAAASHDIRQPMHAASLFVGALAHDPRPRDLPVIGRLQAALTAARQMLDTLLDVSLLDAGAVKRADTHFHAETAGQQLVEMFEPVAARKGIALGLRCPRDLWLFSDPTLVQRVLVNLVGNAVKYTERGAVLIAFRRRGHACLLQVWDTGIGIAEQDRTSIFEEFTQLGNPERDRTRGTGLGLTIVRRLCRLLGSEIVVRSRPGHGSVFAFSVPQGQAAAAAADADVHPPAVQGRVRVRILVVDDDALVRDALDALLTTWGYEVSLAADVEQARTAAGAGAAPDLALIDYRLPGEKTARDAIDAIGTAAQRAVPAIVVTGDTHPQRIREAQALGHPVIFKPVPADVLRAAVSAALSRSA